MYGLQIVACSFSFFLLVIALSILLRFTDSDFTFGIFKLFFFHVMLHIVFSASFNVYVRLYMMYTDLRYFVSANKQWDKLRVRVDRFSEATDFCVTMYAPRRPDLDAV
jgi:hypothetical protein